MTEAKKPHQDDEPLLPNTPWAKMLLGGSGSALAIVLTWAGNQLVEMKESLQQGRDSVRAIESRLETTEERIDRIGARLDALSRRDDDLHNRLDGMHDVMIQHGWSPPK